jgi:hypothetical protein
MITEHLPNFMKVIQRLNFKTVPSLDVLDDCGLRLLRSEETNTNRTNE